MSKTLKKTLSIILTILMLVSSVPFAFAADETPPTREIDGEVYYELDSAEDYLWFVQMCNDSVNPDEPDYEYEDDWYYEPQKEYYIPYNAILTDDIVINSNVIVDGELTEDTASLIEVDPIAKYYEEPETYSYNTSYYTGTFDGNGHSVSGLYMCNTAREYAMFRRVHNDGVVKNLHIKDSYFTGDSSIAALAGINKGTISGCSFDGIVYTTDYYAGGLVSGNSGLIENSYNAGHIHSLGHQNAGIAISNSGTIRNCYNIGTIGNTTDAYQTGGITGGNRGSIENCYNIGEILGDNDVAAISPYNQDEATITNCYFNSDAFSGPAVNTNYNESGLTNVEGKTAADFADSVVCQLVGYHGYVNAECVACGIGYEHEHTTDEQTCMGYKCKYCGIYHGEPAPDNHTYGNYKTTIEAECESTGVETAVCVHCGVAKLEREIPEKGHDWSNKDGVCANNCGLTCEHESYTDTVCDNCHMKCLHESFTDFVCDECHFVCDEHDWSNKDGICAVGCGLICEHPDDKLEWTEIYAPVECTPGKEAAVCTVCGFDAAIKADSTTYPESDHDYSSNSDVTYNFSYEGAYKLLLVFSEETFTEDRFDFIYLYDGNGTEIGKYCGSALSGAEIEIEGNSVSIRLTSDGSVTKYGFKFDAIYAYVYDTGFTREIPVEHDWSNKDGICARGCGAECSHESYTAYVCDTCGYECEHKNYKNGVCEACNYVCPHSFTEFTETVAPKCEETGLEESYCDYCNLRLEQEIPATDHKWIRNMLVRPTQNVDGTWTDGYYYDKCENDEAHNVVTGVAKRADYSAYDEAYKSLKAAQKNANLTDAGAAAVNQAVMTGMTMPQNIVEGESTTAYLNNWVKNAQSILAKIENGEYLKADYTEIDEAIDDIEEKLASENVTDEGKAELEEIKKQLEEMKADENTSAADVAELEKALEDYEEELDKGIEDGTLVMVDGDKIAVELNKKFAEKLEAEGLTDEYEDFIYNQKATDEALAAEKEMIDFANSLEGTVAENAENIAKLNEMHDSFTASFENCLRGTHNFKDYEITSPAKCEVNAKETSTCWFCGETDEREVEGSALEHSFTKYEEVTAPKCGVAGKEVAYCDNGCQTTDERETPALEHLFLDYVSNGDATCTADGTKTASCIHGCGATDTVADEGSMIDHSDEDGDKLCDDCGEEVYDRCDICGGKAHGDDKIQLLFCMIITIIRFVTSILKSIN